MNQKGSAPLLLILIIAVVTGIYFISTNLPKTTSSTFVYSSPSPSIQKPDIITLNKACTTEKELCDFLNRIENDIKTGNAKNLANYQVTKTLSCPNNQCPVSKAQTGYLSGRYQSSWGVSENKFDYQNGLAGLFKPIPSFQGFNIKQDKVFVVYTRLPADKFSNSSFVAIGVKKYPEGYKIGAILYGPDNSGISMNEGEFTNIFGNMEQILDE